MPEPAFPQPGQNQSQPNSNPLTSGTTTNPQEEINKLLVAVEKFRKTGLVEESEVTFAKDKILPKLGYSSEQISELGPVGIMVKLQEEADKKRIGASGINSEPTKEPTQETKPIQAETTTQPKIPLSLESNIDPDSFNELTKQVSQMTDKLSVDIDNEIKKQLEEKKALEQAQEKVDTVLKEHEELSLPQKSKEPETPKPALGLFHTKTEHDKVSPPAIIHDKPYPFRSPEPDEPTTPSDPLEASVANALSSLNEGDAIGNDWTLQKILTTSFGNKKSPFYELLNKTGASWTLSPEEMRDVLRSNILSKNATPVKEIKTEKPEPLHELKKTDEKSSPKEEDQPKNESKEKEPNLTANTNINDKDFDKKEIEEEPESEKEKKSELKEVEKKEFVNKPFIPEVHNDKDKQNFETKAKPEVEEKSSRVDNEQSSNRQHEQTKFNQKQIDFLNRIHADSSLWNAFTSFNPEMWENFHELYEAGKLISIGIDAHPLFDKLANSDFGSSIEIQKGDSASKLLSEAGYNLTWTKDDSEIFAVHIIANHKILVDSIKKIEISGLTVPTIPAPKDVIELAIGAKNGNYDSLHKLVEALNFLPLGSKFKLVKPNQLESLIKYFKR